MDKRIIEAVGGYTILLLFAYFIHKIFGFKDYLGSFIFITFVWGINVYLSFTYKKGQIIWSQKIREKLRKKFKWKIFFTIVLGYILPLVLWVIVSYTVVWDFNLFRIIFYVGFFLYMVYFTKFIFNKASKGN